MVATPAGYPQPARRWLRLPARLRHALAKGAVNRLSALLWPADLPPPASSPPIFSLPPLSFAGISLRTPPPRELPQAYILFHGPGDPLTLQRLLAAWSWAAPVLGEATPLLAAGLPAGAHQALAGLLEGSGLEPTVRILEDFSPLEIAALYPGASAVFLPSEPSPWGDTLSEGLACCRPVVALETPAGAARAGPAAYLAPAGDPRAVGAALVTVVVEESVAEALSQAARVRSSAWNSGVFGQELLAAYQAVLK